MKRLKGIDNSVSRDSNIVTETSLELRCQIQGANFQDGKSLHSFQFTLFLLSSK